MSHRIENEIVCANCGYKFYDISIICDIHTIMTKENIERSICPGCGRMILGTITNTENNITLVEVL